MPTATARFFDRMAPIADVVEPWYEHVYARLRRILRAALRPPRPGARALDAGCGTGFQTVILAGLGYETHGLDLSARSVAVARERVPAALMVGDLVALPYADRAFDAVVCAGSTLDFVETPVRAIEEIGRVLRPGGHLLLECEHKWSLDLGWALASSLTGDPLGFGLLPAQAWRALARPLAEGFWLDYPGYPPLRLFTRRELGAMLGAGGLQPVRVWGIHAVTNVIPSTVLHRPRVGRLLALAYRGLRAVDTLASRFPPARGLASHLVILARRSERQV